jgi:Transposase
VPFIGTDTHKDMLAAVVIDYQRRQLEQRTFANDMDGYEQLVAWATHFRANRIGVEGLGSFGRPAMLALQQAGFAVLAPATGAYDAGTSSAAQPPQDKSAGCTDHCPRRPPQAGPPRRANLWLPRGPASAGAGSKQAGGRTHPPGQSAVC